jgi:hypothetical protein
MATQMTKSQLIEQIATKNELGKKAVKGVMETLAMIGYKELKKNGVFVVPGFAKIHRHQEACDEGPQRYQSLHWRADNLQSETGAEDRESSPGQSRKRRRVTTRIRCGKNRGQKYRGQTPIYKTVVCPRLYRLY